MQQITVGTVQFERIEARPAVIRGRKVNRNWGEAWEQLPERHSAADFDALPKAPK